MTDTAAYVADFIKARDLTIYYSTLFLPPARRAAVQAVWAFVLDLRDVRDRVSEPAPGEIRLQWWHDFIEGTEHGSTLNNPLAAALSDVISTYDLPTGPLRRMIAARRFDLYDDPMPDTNSFEGYAGETLSSAYQFAATILNGGNDPDAADASGHLGVAHAYLMAMRAAPIWATRGQIWLPKSTFDRRGVTEPDIFARTKSEAMSQAFADFRAECGAHLEKAQTAIALLPTAIRPAFSMLPVLQADLARLNSAGETPFEPARAELPLRKLLRIWWWSLSQR